MKNNNFRLSAAGKLAATLAIILATSGTVFAGGIVAANGSRGPGVSTAGTGAQVVDIVTPNGKGLSHNQYQDFNVNRPGAVLNNSRTGGQSQLAGQIGANPNLVGREAKVILNEVIGRNPSLLHGQQEIFGMAADYVLANPNGISCQGCGFINTNRASLVVGGTMLEDGQLTGFNTHGYNTLSLNGNVATNGVLDLIAPKIDSRGQILAQNTKDKNGKVIPSQINAISGHNVVSRDGKILSSSKPQSALDSYYLGSMQAGRINIINTAQGSGVKLAGRITADEDLRVKAYNIRSESGISNTSTSSDGRENYKNGFGAIYVNNSSSNQTLNRTELKGKNITLLADNEARFTATDISGQDITLQGANLTLDSQQLKQTQRNINNRWYFLWQYDVTRDNEKLLQAGSTVNATGNAKLISTKEDVKILGSTVTAGNELSVQAARNIQLSGLVERNRSSERGYKKNDTAKLITGHWNNSDESENLKFSELRGAGNVKLNAGNDVVIQGSKVNAKKNLVVTAGNSIKVDVQKTANNKNVRDDTTYWGGIGGGNNANNHNRREVSNSSELTSDGVLFLNSKQDVTITGSKARGKAGGFVRSEEGKLIIDNAISNETNKIDSRTGTIFNITSSSREANNSRQHSTGSEVKSDSNLQLISKQDLDVIGSEVASIGHLQVKSQTGNVNVKTAVTEEKINEEKTTFGINAYAKESGDKQYRAGLRIEHTTDTEKTTNTKNHASSLRGGSVDISASPDKDVTFTGSHLASEGDATVSGNKVSFLAAEDKTLSETEQTKIGGGIYYTGGIDKVGKGYEIGYENSKTNSGKSTAITSGSDIKGNFTINAKDKLTNQGAQHNVGKHYQQNAGSVDNLAANNSEHSTTETNNFGVDIGVNVDYSSITRPVERAIDKVSKLDVNGATNDIGSIGTPNLGLDLTLSGDSTKKESKNSQAVITNVTAGSIGGKSAGAIKDQGTKYQATEGGINITAGSYRNDSAYNTSDESSTEIKGTGGVRVYTTTGKDITVDAKGQGGKQNSESASRQASTGSFNAANGINITVDEDAIYEGTTLNAGKGKAIVNAGGNVKFNQATDSKSEKNNGYNINASAKVGVTPDGQSIGGGFGGGTNSKESSSTTAHVSNIAGEQGVEINAGKDITLQGSKVSSKGDVELRAGNKVNLLASESSQMTKENNLGGNINLGGSSSSSKDKSSGGASIGGAFDYVNVDESSIERQGGNIITDGKLRISAGSKESNAIHLQGTGIMASEVEFDAPDSSVLVESAQSEQHKNNVNVGIKANASASQSFNKDDKGNIDQASGKDTHTLGASAKFGVETLDKRTNANSNIKTGVISFNTAGDVKIAGGNIEAGKVGGRIGGDLIVESRKDFEKGFKIDADGGISHTNDASSSVTSKLSKVGTSHYSGKVKEKLENGVNKIADATTEKYNDLARRFDSKQDTTGTVSSNEAENKTSAGEKPQGSLIDRGFRNLGDWAINKFVGPAGGQGHLKFNVDIVNNNAVGNQSSIKGNDGVSLQIGGKTKLIGGEIRSENGQVDLGHSEIVTEDINGENHKSGGGVSLNGSLPGLAIDATQQIINGKTPFINAHSTTEQIDAKGGVFKGK